MLNHVLPSLALFLILLVLLDLLARRFPVTASTTPSAKITSSKTLRPLRPRTPEDCPACCHAASQPIPPTASPVRPWREVKSRRGRRKTIPTDGYACPYVDCRYHNIPDANVHALVGYGHYGNPTRIQNLYCQACQHKFSVRRHTPLYRLKTSARKVGRVLTALAEGLSVSGAVQTFGYTEQTITRWLVRAGAHGERVHGRFFRNLQFVQVQLDELRTTLRNTGHEVWLWVAFDAKTKIIAAVQMGSRTKAWRMP